MTSSRVARHGVLVLAFLISAALQPACSKLNPTLQPAPAPSPSPTEASVVKGILDHYLEAIGGKEKIDAITTYKMRGRFQIPNATMQGTIESLGKEPNKTLSIIQFPGLGPMRKGFDGETRWVQTPVGTFSSSEPEEFSQLERDAEVYRAGKIGNLYESMKLENNARLSGRDVYVIEGKQAKGPAEKLFFDVENGMLVRWDMARKTARGTVFVKVHLNDYREVDGVKVPFNVRFNFESFSLAIQLDELQHNVPIDDAVFKKPN